MYISRKLPIKQTIHIGTANKTSTPTHTTTNIWIQTKQYLVFQTFLPMAKVIAMHSYWVRHHTIVVEAVEAAKETIHSFFRRRIVEYLPGML